MKTVLSVYLGAALNLKVTQLPQESLGFRLWLRVPRARLAGIEILF